MGIFFPGVLQRYFFWGWFSRGIYSKVFILGVFFPLTIRAVGLVAANMINSGVDGSISIVGWATFENQYQ